jgi:hypothetical protein
MPYQDSGQACDYGSSSLPTTTLRDNWLDVQPAVFHAWSDEMFSVLPQIWQKNDFKKDLFINPSNAMC